MWRFVYLFFAIFPAFSFAQTLAETEDFIRLHKHDSYELQCYEGKSGCCHYYVELRNPDLRYRNYTQLHFSFMVYPVTIVSKGGVDYIKIQSSVKKGAGKVSGIERWYGPNIFEEEDEFFHYRAADPKMTTRLAKAFDHLIKGCNGVKKDLDLFK